MPLGLRDIIAGRALQAVFNNVMHSGVASNLPTWDEVDRFELMACEDRSVFAVAWRELEGTRNAFAVDSILLILNCRTKVTPKVSCTNGV